MAVSIEEIGSAKESNINVQIPPKTEPENSQKQQEVIKLEKKKKKKKGIFQKKEEKSSEEQYSSDFVIPGMEIPVSYTHLDVYKRQQNYSVIYKQKMRR